MGRKRWSIRSRVPLAALAATTLLVSSGAQTPGPPASDEQLVLIPNELVASLAAAATPIHQYASQLLASVGDLSSLPPPIQSQLTRVEPTNRLEYRAWSGAADPPPDENELAALGEGYYLVGLIGPPDPAWRQQVEELGIAIVDAAEPYGFVVRASGSELVLASRLTTSFGVPLVRAVRRVPLEARVAPELLRLARGEVRRDQIPGLLLSPSGRAVIRVTAYSDRDPASIAEQVRGIAQAADTALARLAGAPEEARDVFVVDGPEILSILERVAGVAYIEPLHQRERHNNLAAKDYILNVEPMWSAGRNGGGVSVLHNDSGVDLSHPDFPAGTFVATLGAMSNTDNGHGTHTAGSVAGRGILGYSPTNTSGCGDVTPPLTSVRGMAWGARLAVNNLFDGGLTSETAMMQWGYQQGARLSTNSWGYRALYSYSSQAVSVDGATRDADGAQSGNQEMLMVFSAGNDGPSAGTVISPGLAKNAITVGATQNDRCGSYIGSNPNINTITDFSSRGPSQGRVKPDVVAVGADLLSTESGDPQATHPWDQTWTGPDYELSPGTSMSCPLVAGSAAVFFQSYSASFGSLPSPALAKAAIINGAVDVGPGYLSYAQGWGRLNLRRSTEGPPGGKINFIDQPDVAPLATSQFWTQTFHVLSSAVPLKITVVWTDPPGTAGSSNPLRNNLDLLVTAPGGGTVYRGNRFTGAWSTPNPGATTDTANNVENVFVQSPAAGEWTIRVSSASTTINPPGLSGQDFALAYSGDASPCPPLSAPAGLSATPFGDNRIDLSWGAVTGATQYRVFRSTTSGGPYSQIGSAPSTSFSDTTASGGVTYYYVVRAAAGSNCESADSNEATAVTTGDCLLAPTFAGLASVTVPADACRRLRLDWSAATANCGGTGSLVYNVYRSTTSSFTPGPADRIASCVTDLFYEDTGVTGGVTYYYVVRAEDATVGGGGSCNGGNEDANLVQRNGTVGVDILYRNDFETGTGLGDWGRVNLGGDAGSDWRGIRTCAATSGTKVFRFGGNQCSTNYTNNQFELAEPATATGIVVPSGAASVRLSFSHRWNWESDASFDYDGGQLRLSLDHVNYTVIPGSAILQNGYDSTSAFGCRPAGSSSQPMWGRDRATFVNTVVDLDAACNLITGGGSGCAGQTLWIGFTAMTDCVISDFGWFIDDVEVTADTGGACGARPNAVQFFTATSKDGQNKLEWVNPASGGYASTLIRFRTDQFPANALDGTLVVEKVGALGAKDSFVHSGRPNGIHHYYSAFAKNSGGGTSTAMTVRARPQLTSGAVKWVYNTGASAVTAPSIGSVFTVSNDRGLHSMNQGATGGDWPGPWFPFATNQPAQARSPVASLAAGKRIFIGSQDGHVYAVDGVSGALVWKSPKLGDMIQAAPGASFAQFGGVDRILVGTRNASGDNRFYGLRLTDGSVAWSFDNGGGANGIGVINSQASVDYANGRVYFASRQRAGGSPATVWCLSFNATGASLLWARNLGNIDGSPILRNGKIYVGTNASQVHALDPATGEPVWSAPFGCNDGMVKGFVWVASATDLYLTTTNTVWALTDNGTTVSEKWRVTTVPAPSIPLFTPGSHFLLMGSSDGQLYQLDVNASPPSIKSVQLGDGLATVGSPALDLVNGLLYVGATSGAIYAVAVPLQ